MMRLRLLSFAEATIDRGLRPFEARSLYLAGKLATVRLGGRRMVPKLILDPTPGGGGTYPPASERGPSSILGHRHRLASRHGVVTEARLTDVDAGSAPKDPSAYSQGESRAGKFVESVNAKRPGVAPEASANLGPIGVSLAAGLQHVPLQGGPRSVDSLLGGAAPIKGSGERPRCAVNFFGKAGGGA